MQQDISILIVEDERSFVYLDKDMLQRTTRGLKLKVTVAEDGMQALTHISSQKELPNVILLDLNMPLMDGYEFLKALKVIIDAGEVTSVYMLSSLIPEVMRNKIERLNIVKDFFEKPLNEMHVKLILSDLGLLSAV